MCYMIDANYVLIHKLMNKKSCTMGELFRDKCQIESQYNDVFLDVSKTSIDSSVYQFPEIFKCEGDVITKVEGSEKYFSEPLINYFNCSVEKSYREPIAQLLS